MATNRNDSSLVAILLVLAALVVFPMIVMGGGMMGFGSMMGAWEHGMWGGGAMPGWMLLVGVLMQLLFLAAIVGAGYLLYRAVAGSDDDADRALEELRVAYARGELTDEEYEQRRDALERDR
ncbi:SHOCT domain-containing protein [Natronoarchaeum rubrum]|uniref:SHOCT domain-containing protein n=1 Tax=Natronoarchaeum rubrum TaxID=755311 RepID=UPI0021116C7C|nr:SHOCT domain-containing protein [Natronoarchaeum rubrum]